MVLVLNKSRVIMALQAFQKDRNLSIKYVSMIYKVSRTTLTARSNSRILRRDILTNLINLTLLEEETILKHIIDLIKRGFPPK